MSVRNQLEALRKNHDSTVILDVTLSPQEAQLFMHEVSVEEVEWQKSGPGGLNRSKNAPFRLTGSHAGLASREHWASWKGFRLWLDPPQA